MATNPTQQCLDNIRKLPNAQPCPAETCNTIQDALNEYCQATGLAIGSPVPQVSNGQMCYCCCSCMSTAMQIAVGIGQYRAAEELVPGDTILTASVEAATGKLVWSQTPVEFSQGAGNPAGQSLMIMLLFKPEGRAEEYLIVSRNQLIYMPDGTLRKAATLVPGLDVLLLADGREAPLIGMSTGMFQQEHFHYIATSRMPASDVNNHLIDMKGVVIGDYALQLSDAGSRIDNEEALPVFGTEAYTERYDTYITGDASFAVATSLVTGEQTNVTEHFRLMISECTQPVNQYFFTSKQAQDIETNPDTRRRPSSSTEGVDMATYLFALYEGYYTDIQFSLEMENNSINSFAVLKDQQKHVIVPKGLVQLEAVKFESLAVIIAHSIGCFIGGSPENEDGYPCTGLADYIGVDTVVRRVWYGSHFDDIMFPAMEQLEKIFHLIVPASDREGVPGNTCMNISTRCRMEAMAAAMGGNSLPACAGGG